jgi:hypothetical protein
LWMKVEIIDNYVFQKTNLKKLFFIKTNCLFPF